MSPERRHARRKPVAMPRRRGSAASIARRLFGAAAALAVLTFALRASAVVQLRAAEPLIADLRLGSLASLSQSNPDGRREALARLLEQIQAAGRAGDPSASANRLLVLRPADFTLRFDELSTDQQYDLQQSADDIGRARDRYERATADLMTQLLRDARIALPRTRLSVYGLPLENSDDVNRRYAAVIDQLDVIVSARSFRGGASGLGGISIHRDLPAALTMAAGRPVYYMVDNSWMAAVGTASPSRGDLSGSGATSAAAAKGGGSWGRSRTDANGREAAAGAGAASGGSGGGSSGSGGGAFFGGASGGGSSGGGAGGIAGGGSSFGSGISGSGGAGGAAPPDDPSMPSSGRKLWILEPTSDAVKAQYTQYNARDCIIIGQAGIDPDDNGTFEHPDLLQQHLNYFVPMSYTGPVLLDWEGQGTERLKAPNGSEVQLATVQEFVTVVTLVKQLRPHAKVGFYGLPLRRYEGRNAEWHEQSANLQPIFQASDCLFPSIYDFYKTHQNQYHDPAEDLAYVRDNVRMALEFAGGKPVYPVVWHRWHDSNAIWGLHLIPSSELRAHATAAFQTAFAGVRAAGLVWWGDDVAMRAFSLQDLPPNHPSYALQQIVRQIFDDEIPEGMADSAYFDGMLGHRMQVLSQVLAASPN